MQDAALHIGLIGMGTVGTQVADRLLNRRDTLRRRAGVELLLKRALVRDVDRQRGIEVPAGVLTTDPSALLDNPEIDVVVEVAGGDEPARSYLERAIRSGKHVVTANKVVMAKHGPELLELAGEMNVDVYFEAAVGGGIPLISTFKVDLLANEIQRIMAVINGTTNYVLGRMANQGLDLREAVLEAQTAGYAEADPTEDVGGFDAAYKLAIMASIGFGARVHPDQVYREGIEGIEPVDFRYARELGYDVKLLAYAARDGEGQIEARVHPVLVPHGHPLAAVEGPANAVYIEGDLVGPVLLQGLGAGGRPTASSVVGDIIDLARSIHRQVQNRAAFEFDPDVRVMSMDEVRSRAYFRCHVADRPGVLAKICTVFGEEGVSIASAIQKESDDVSAEFVVTTHPAADAALRRTRARIARLDVVDAVDSFLRVL
ncbi:MAG TPA: homoserine dehydrogenase [Candidatus Dormibacteraeota bacterium]|nr:homoserine dehydrogenase [Candidatus Dormibacteraeota bacterium]